MRSVIGFPDPVDEVSARLVAGGVVVMAVATIALDQPWLTAVIAYGFLARVLTGPRLSPLGRLVTQVVRPRLAVAPRLVPGPPKRFAQGIGAVLSTTAAVLALGLGSVGVAYGFLARVLTGPRLSPLGRLVTQVVRPRLAVAPRLVPGPPKRFAQGIGAVLSTTAAVLALGLGSVGVAYGLLAALVVAAGLEAFAGVCLGCIAFAQLMRVGVIPAEVCERCADLWGARRAEA